MNIIPIFQEIITRNVSKEFDKYLYNTLEQFNNTNPIDNYINLNHDLDALVANFGKEAYEAFILKLDEDYMHSEERKRKYDSKGFITKPLLTKFGWINFKRRKYVNKENGTTFKFIDQLLNIKKYTRIDVFVIAELCEEAAYNSYAKAGRIVSKTIGTKIKYDDNPNKVLLSRATTRNNVLKASEIMEKPENENVSKEIEELNILLDEKMVPSQFNNKKDFMVKSAVVFEGYKTEYNKRTRLTGKEIFGNIEAGHEDLLNDVVDYIYCNYKTSKLTTINIMGDGANWIKAFALGNVLKFHKDITVIYGLDLFHAMQAIMKITTTKHPQYKELLTEYLYRNKKDEFIKLCDVFLKLNKHREDKIIKNVEYIKNNWEYAQNTIHHIKYKCSMESNISHILADIFTARPKAYSRIGLQRLLNIRLLAVNGYDLKKEYLNSLKRKTEEENQNAITHKITKYRKSNKIVNNYYDYFNVSLIDKNLEFILKRQEDFINY